MKNVEMKKQNVVVARTKASRRMIRRTTLQPQNMRLEPTHVTIMATPTTERVRGTIEFRIQANQCSQFGTPLSFISS